MSIVAPKLVDIYKDDEDTSSFSRSELAALVEDIQKMRDYLEAELPTGKNYPRKKVVSSTEDKWFLDITEDRDCKSYEIAPDGIYEATWEESPHNGDHLFWKSRWIPCHEAIQVLEKYRTSYFAKVKAKAREEAINKITNKKLKKLGLHETWWY